MSGYFAEVVDVFDRLEDKLMHDPECELGEDVIFSGLGNGFTISTSSEDGEIFLLFCGGSGETLISETAAFGKISVEIKTQNGQSCLTSNKVLLSKIYKIFKEAKNILSQYISLVLPSKKGISTIKIRIKSILD